MQPYLYHLARRIRRDLEVRLITYEELIPALRAIGEEGKKPNWVLALAVPNMDGRVGIAAFDDYAANRLGKTYQPQE